MTFDKKVFRKQMRQIRAAIPKDSRLQKDRSICERIKNCQLYKEADKVFSYVSINSEAGTAAINTMILSDGKILALPKVISNTKMRFYEVTKPEDLIRGCMDIPEPDESVCPLCIPDKNTLILMPGLSFDRELYRMGYGGGYYDRYLAQYRESVSCVMIAYDEQRADSVPHDLHDQKPDYIITDKEIYQ